MVQMQFDATRYDPNTGGGDVFETGEYTFSIVNSEVKQTKAGNGTMLVFTLSCVDEGQVGKRLQVRLNVQNPNPTAVDISLRDLSAISHVVGVLNWTDTQQLHGRLMRVRVEKVPRTDDPSKFGNEVRAYLDVNGNPPGKQGGGAAQAPVPPAPPQTAAPVAPPVPAPAPAPAPAPVAPPAPAPAPAPAPGVAPPWAGQAAAPTPEAAAAANPPWAQPGS